MLIWARKHDFGESLNGPGVSDTCAYSACDQHAVFGNHGKREQVDRLALTINTAAQANLIRVAEAIAEWCLGMYGIEEV
jgi:hypothetical protein